MLLEHPYVVSVYVLAFILIIYFILSSEIRYNIMFPESYAEVVKTRGHSDTALWAMKGSSMNGFRIGLVVIEVHADAIVLHVAGRARVIKRSELSEENLTEKCFYFKVAGVKLKVSLYHKQYLVLKAFMGLKDQNL